MEGREVVSTTAVLSSDTNGPTGAGGSWDLPTLSLVIIYYCFLLCLHGVGAVFSQLLDICAVK